MRFRSRFIPTFAGRPNHDRVAAERLRSNHDARPAHERFVGMDNESQDELLRLGKRVVEDPLRTCPHCLYDLSGTDRGQSIGPCPECGRAVSGPAAALVWSQDAIRSRRCMLAGFLLIPLLTGATLGFAVLGMNYLPALSYVAMFCYYLAWVCLFAVPYWAWKWRRLRRPRGSMVAAGVVAVAVTFVNLVLFVFVMAIA